jgi:hypothetical protein
MSDWKDYDSDDDTNIDDWNFDHFLMKYRKLDTCNNDIMRLRLFVDSDDLALECLYRQSAQEHNRKIYEDPCFYDAGFDIFSTKAIEPRVNEMCKMDFQIKCCAEIFSFNSDSNDTLSTLKSKYTPFYTYARSSLSKTSLRLANNQGIIDAGYRGNLIGMFDIVQHKEMSIIPLHSRLLQICAPSLMPIYVDIVDDISLLGPSTSRGVNGLGSTGLNNVKKLN